MAAAVLVVPNHKPEEKSATRCYAHCNIPEQSKKTKDGQFTCVVMDSYPIQCVQFVGEIIQVKNDLHL